MTDSERRWLEVRSYLQEHRHELGNTALAEYPQIQRVAGTALLTRPEWIPSRPLRLDAIDLELRSTAPAAVTAPAAAGDLLPLRVDGGRYPSYSAAMAELAAPAVFENRATYRLLEADLTGPRGRLVFGRGRYFDGLDVGEAAAHEYAANRLSGAPMALREAIGDPCDLAGRPANLAISTLTLCLTPCSTGRLDHPGSASFLVHWRDPAKVGHAGGLYQVLPVGMFQPVDDSPDSERNDLSLWRCMVREYAEELLGVPEDHRRYGSPLDYAAWPFAADMTAALDRADAKAFVLGLGVDPLTFATDLLTAVALPRSLFGELFGQLVTTNREGTLVTGSAGVHIPFTADSVDRFTTAEPMQAAGAALLRSAWQQRQALLTR